MTKKTHHPLRAWRIRNLMTLGELGALLGYGAPFISEVECYKKNPSEQMLIAIQRVTGLRRLGKKRDAEKKANGK